MEEIRLLNGDCLEVMKALESASVDSLVTDPPAGISFMGKDWDGDKGGRKQWIAWMTEVMRECLRVMKPGAHGLVWALPRTSHWTATALEDAGFEVRDVVTHLFGSGFPKSLDVSKAIDKAAGAERTVVGSGKRSQKRAASGLEHRPWMDEQEAGEFSITAPATDAAKQWQGFGTALKPASEHWILVRKPCSEKTVAANVLKWGTGALNIDASRIGVADSDPNKRRATGKEGGADSIFGVGNSTRGATLAQGRFPANLVFSHTPYCTDAICDLECAIKALDGQSGISKSTGGNSGMANLDQRTLGKFKGAPTGQNPGKGDVGGASRFFYCAKISKSERNAGCEDMIKEVRRSDARPNSGDSSGKFPDHDSRERSGNHHPTVKPKKLMTYLIRMVTPPGGIVLDPFMGSGSTGVAASEAGFPLIGVERDAEYFAIASQRIAQTHQNMRN